MRPSRLDRKQLETLEQKIFVLVKKVIDKVDPESLLKLDCPKDEYDETSKLIARAVVREGAGGLNRTDLAHIAALALHSQYNQWTRPVMIHGLYFDIADKLLPVLPKIKR